MPRAQDGSVRGSVEYSKAGIRAATTSSNSQPSRKQGAAGVPVDPCEREVSQVAGEWSLNMPQIEKATAVWLLS